MPDGSHAAVALLEGVEQEPEQQVRNGPTVRKLDNATTTSFAFAWMDSIRRCASAISSKRKTLAGLVL